MILAVVKKIVASAKLGRGHRQVLVLYNEMAASIRSDGWACQPARFAIV